LLRNAGASVDARHERIASQEGGGEAVEVSVDAGDEQPEVAPSTGKVAAQAHDAVGWTGPEHERPDGLAAGHGGKCADGGPPGHPSRHLRCAEDGARSGHVGIRIVDQSAELRGAPDAAGVEELGEVAEPEHPGTFEEEWPALREERL